MKKLLLAVIALTACSHMSLKAEPLFPFFVDLVMDFTEQPASYTYYHGKTDGGGATQAGAFLKSVLPTSYKVNVAELTWENGSKVRAYSSPMLDDKVSVIYFITDSSGNFSIDYAEGLPSEVPAHNTAD